MLGIEDSKREVNSYNPFSLVRGDHASSYKEGGLRFLLTNPKLRKRNRIDMSRAKKVALASI